MPNIINQTEQRSVYLGRLATGLLKAQIFPTLEQAYKAARLILLDAENITSNTQLNAVTAEIRRVVQQTINDGWSAASDELNKIAIYDAAHYAKLTGAAAGVELTVPADAKILSYVNKAIMSLTQGQQVDAGLWPQFTKAYSAKQADRFDSIVKYGYSQGETVQQMVAKLRVTFEGLARNEAEALMRTGVQHYAVQARNAMFIDNDVDELVYVATLDNRTTSLCAGRDLKRYKIGTEPSLPAHWNCRSAYVPAIAMQDVETRSAVGGKDGKEAEKAYDAKKETLDQRRDARAEDRAAGIATPETPSKPIYRGKKDSNAFKAGQVKATSYDEWLRKQPTWFVESTLGKQRAELFLSGKVSMSQFNDMTGRQLTLAELRALDGG